MMNIKTAGAITVIGTVVICLLLAPRKPAINRATSPATSQAESPMRPAQVSTNQPMAIPVYQCQVKHAWPHDRHAFTQGLLFFGSNLFESTGLNGQSSLRKLDWRTGEVLQKIELPTEYFAEGLALFGGNLFQLTWLNQRCFVYDAATFKKIKEFDYQGEGWGLTADGQSLIMSDGTDQLRFLNPKTFAVTKVIHVTAQGKPVNRLNELEFIKGEVFANIWQTPFIIRVDPANGNVTGVIDCNALLTMIERDQTTDVLNGIAYLAAEDKIFVTGKNWPKLFEIELALKSP
jgi:glutamine cyclotransferase